jgi:alpha-L-fucosidase
MNRFLLALCIIVSSQLVAQKYEPNWNSLNKRGIPKWFNQDKFGIFIHWGTYAVPAYAPVIPNSGTSYSEWYWSKLMEPEKYTRAFHDKNYGKDFPYENFEKMFHAELYDPAYWAKVFKLSGAKYVVLTSKHHEGYCLWPSAEADKTWGRPWNAVSGTPKRDLLGDLTDAVRKEGLKMGYYYSLYEWFNPLWKSDKKRYVSDHMFPQFKDLVTRYKPSVIFSDGEWELSDTAWRSEELLAWLFNESPVKDDVVVDDRWGSNTRGKNTGSTYSTSEYGSGMDASVVWEESQGIGSSYGYNRNEQLADYKTGKELVFLLVDIVARGGNLLLDIGPTGDGRIPVIMQERLTEIGSWLDVNGEAIFSTTAYKTPYQWSPGPKPVKKGEAYMAGYSPIQRTLPQKDKAYIEAFFTQKGKDLYAFIPAFKNSITIRGFKPAAGAKASVVGVKGNVPFKVSGGDCVVDLKSIRPGDISADLFVIKFSGGL